MAFASTVISETPAIADHGGSRPPTARMGGGDEDGGSGPHDYDGRLRRARLGLLFAIAPILVLFLTFTVAFLFRHAVSTLDTKTAGYIQHWQRVPLPTSFLLLNTLILLAGSCTMEVARRRFARDVALAPLRSIPGVSVGRERGFPWLAASAVLGLAFLVGQIGVWRRLYAEGFYLSSGAGSSFVYLLTAAHAVHLAGGLCVLLYAVAIRFMSQPIEARHIIVDVSAWYWHFMLALWLAIFGLIEFVR